MARKLHSFTGARHCNTPLRTQELAQQTSSFNWYALLQKKNSAAQMELFALTLPSFTGALRCPTPLCTVKLRAANCTR
eukprot:1334378-Lingulodinium_polyedra.AAC.1